MSPYKTIRIREEGDTMVVCVGGYLNSLLGEEVEKVVRARLDEGGRRILLNFQGTRLVNSIGISFVIGVVEKVMEQEGRMAFCEVSRINRDLFRVTGLAKYVRSFETEKEALEFLSGNA
ncbi:MAG: STAS domain-containing protein [Deltaproteobacteria bacterium]|nr:STAS domain-containing protein [Deltaproteobacteria bacterium]